MPTPKVLPKVSFSMGANQWGLTIEENGQTSALDFSTLDRPGRRKARRMLVEALTARGYFDNARTASQRRA